MIVQEEFGVSGSGQNRPIFRGSLKLLLDLAIQQSLKKKTILVKDCVPAFRHVPSKSFFFLVLEVLTAAV